jgi:toxin CcdB
MQHDVFDNPLARARRAFPFVTVLQADISIAGTECIVAPLMLRSSVALAPGRLVPVVGFGGADYLLPLELMGSLPLNRLRTPVGSIAAHHDAIVRALDWLFTGV